MPGEDNNKSLKLLLVAGLAILLAACQPSPEERVQRVDAYLAEADFRSAAIELRNVLQAEPGNADARLKLARSSYQLGDFSDSANQFERALGLGKTAPEVWIGLGRSLLSQGRAANAFERVVPNLDAESNDEAVQVFLGDVLLALGNYDDAADHYARAVRINRSSAGGLIGEAMILAAGGRDAEAEQVFAHAERLAPDASIIWLAKGNYLRSKRRFAEAADAYLEAIELGDPYTPLGQQFSAQVNAVSALIDARRLDEAAEQLAALNTRYSGHPVSGFLRGRLAFANGDFDTAQLTMQEYLAQNPRDARGEAILGAINFSQDNLRQAELYLLNAVRVNAGGDATRRLLAETQLRLNKPEDALVALKSGNVLDPDDFMYLAMLGRAEIAAGDTAAAIHYFERAVAQNPQNPSISLALAAAYLKDGRTADAIEVLRAMPMESGSQFRRQSILIAALVQQGDRARAIAESDLLIEANKNDAAAYVVAGALRQLLGEDQAARSFYEQALAIEPDNLTALHSLGRMDLASGRLAGAEQNLRKLLDSHATHVPAIVSLGTVLQRDGRLADLRPYLERAAEQAPDSIVPQIILARVELALARPDQTLKIVNEVSSRYPNEPELDHLRGLAMLAKGDFSLAIPPLVRAAGAAPDNPGYQYDLAQAQLAGGRATEALETARRFTRLLPRDPRGTALAIEAAVRAGLDNRAREAVDDFAINNPGHPLIPKFRGDVSLATGDAEAAIRYYEGVAETNWGRDVAEDLARAYSVVGSDQALVPLQRWLREHPDDHGIRFLLAQLSESFGLVEQAVTEYERLLAVDALNPIGMNNLAWQYFVVGDGRALQLAERAYELAPDNGSIADTLGWIRAQDGDLDRAVPLLREAVALEPGNAEIRFHLASALADSGKRDEAMSLLRELLDSGEAFPSRAEAQRLAGEI